MATWGAYFASYVKKAPAGEMAENVDEKRIDAPPEPAPIKVNAGVTRPTTTKKLYGSTIELTEEKRVDVTQPIGSNAGRMANLFGYTKPATAPSMSQVVNDAIQKSKLEAQAGPKVAETVAPLPTLITSMPQTQSSLISAVSPKSDLQSTTSPAVVVSPTPKVEPQPAPLPGFFKRNFFAPKTSVSVDTDQAAQTITGTALVESPVEMGSSKFRSPNQSISSISNLDSLMADLQSNPVEPAPRRRGTKQSVSLAATQNSLDDIMATLQNPVVSARKSNVTSQLATVTTPAQGKAITAVIRDSQPSSSAGSSNSSVVDEDEIEEFVESRAWAHVKSLSQFRIQQDLMEEERLRMEEEDRKFQQQEKQFAEEQEQQRLFLEEVRRAQEQQALEEAERERVAQEEAERRAEDERILREIEEERIAKEKRILDEINAKEAQEKKRLAEEARKREQDEMQREVQRLIKEEEDKIRKEEGARSPVNVKSVNKTGYESEVENYYEESVYSDELVESEDEDEDARLERLAAEREEYEAEMAAARSRDERINAERTEKQRKRAEKEKAYDLQYQREAEGERGRYDQSDRRRFNQGGGRDRYADEEAQRLRYEEELEQLRLDEEMEEQRRRNDVIKQERRRFQEEEEERERYVQQEAERARYEAEQEEELQRIAARLQAEDEAAEKEEELRKAEEKIRAAFSGLAKQRGQPEPVFVPPINRAPVRSNTTGVPPPQARDISGGLVRGNTVGGGSRQRPSQFPVSPVRRNDQPLDSIRGNSIAGPRSQLRGNPQDYDRDDGGRGYREPPQGLLRGNTVGGRQPPTQAAPPRPLARGNTTGGRLPPRGLPSGPKSGVGLPSGPRPRRA